MMDIPNNNRKSEQETYNISDVLVTLYVEAHEDLDAVAEALRREYGSDLSVKTGQSLNFESYGLKAKITDIKKQTNRSGIIKIILPVEIFETDNIPQILAVLTGNIFGIRTISSLRLRDVSFPDKFLEANRGPAFGISGIRELLGIYDRPLTAITIKGALGMRTTEYIEKAYQIWSAGVDIILDDPVLTDQDFNPFYDRVLRMYEIRRKIEEETKEKKLYFPNISARVGEMYARGTFVRNMGGRGVMVDTLSVGFSGIQFLHDQTMGVCIHAHRVMPGAFMQNERHGVSMNVYAKLARLAGVDQLHMGSTEGEHEGSVRDVLLVDSFLKKGWAGIRPIMPFISGGLHVSHIPKLISTFGKDITIHISSSVLAHPQGVHDGVRLFMHSLQSTLKEQESHEHMTKVNGKKYKTKKEKDKNIQNPLKRNSSTYVHTLALAKSKNTLSLKKN